MTRTLSAALALCLLAAPAHARHRHRGHHVPWCGLYMMKITGHHDPRLARAIEWRREGYDAGGPCVGCIGVMPHHVLIVREVLGNGMILATSGNDGNAVRTRIWSTRRIIAWRRL